jgi:putative oxidoreductase
MNKYLLSGGTFSILVALLHVAIILGGPDWYRFWGAGEQMARLEENGSLFPDIITFFIAVIFLIWGLYAFSGAGLIRRLPLLKTGLVVISSIYTIRGLLLIVDIAKPEQLTGFMLVTSIVSLIVGLSHFIGTKQIWASMSK